MVVFAAHNDHEALGDAMTKKPAALPDALGTHFSVGAAMAAGSTRSRMWRSDLERPFIGARSLVMPRDKTLSAAELEEADAWRRIRAYAEIMPEHAFFIGPTAALIGGVPLPRGLHSELHVGVLTPRTPPRRPRDRGASLATFLGEYDLVAATDYLMRIPRNPGNIVPLTRTKPYVTREQLTRLLDTTKWRGAPLLRRALARARTSSSSRPETLVRLMAVDGGLPEPVLDYDILDENGNFLACADLAYPDLLFAIEYDGAVHRDKDRFVHDIDRTTRIHEAGWTDLHLSAPHVFIDREEGIRRLRAAYSRAKEITGVPFGSA